MANNLRQHAGRSLVLTGDHQPPAVHAWAHALIMQWNNVGQTVIYTMTVDETAAQCTWNLPQIHSRAIARAIALL